MALTYHEVEFNGLLTSMDLETGPMPDKENQIALRFIVSAEHTSNLVAFVMNHVHIAPSPEKAGRFTLCWQELEEKESGSLAATWAKAQGNPIP